MFSHSSAGQSSIGTGDALDWWRKAHEQLSGMKARGIMLPTDEQYLAILRQKAGGT